MIRRALVAGALLLLVGCSAPATGSGEPEVVEPADVVSVPEPTAVTIPALDAHSSLVPLGLTPDGELATPPVDRPMQAGYFAGPDVEHTGDEVLPGEVGPAVIAAHVDGVVNGRKGQPGLFHQLHTLKPGDEVLVDRGDGTQLRFVVQRVERHPKDAFPTQAVYGDTAGPELRLVTCGGAFNRATGHYLENTIVWAVLA